MDLSGSWADLLLGLAFLTVVILLCDGWIERKTICPICRGLGHIYHGPLHCGRCPVCRGAGKR